MKTNYDIKLCNAQYCEFIEIVSCNDIMNFYMISEKEKILKTFFKEKIQPFFIASSEKI